VTTDKRARQKANRARRVAAAEEADRRARRRSRMLMYGGLAVLVVVIVVAVAMLTSDDCDGDTTAPAVTTTTVSPSDSQPAADSECPPVEGSADPRIDFPGAFPMCIDPELSYTAVFDTSHGEVVVELDTENTPNTTNNFVSLARWGYYDDTTLFRTDPSIEIIQGGSPHTNSASDPGPGYTIPDEPTFETDPDTGQLTGPYRYEPGQLVMARSAGPDSSGAQFFFTTGPNSSFLDSQGTYIVFGATDDAGLEVLESIIALHESDDSGLGGRPSETVTVNSVTILET
jgi:cyclophilin family peptidyl-prolyl cis-trans isomerase